MLAWYEAMNEALKLANADCHGMIKHLFQAALSAPIRHRCSPSFQMVQLDSLYFSEVLRTAGTACVDSFWDFAAKVDSLLPNTLGSPKTTVNALLQQLAQNGLRFKGRDISRHTALALDALAPSGIRRARRPTSNSRR